MNQKPLSPINIFVVPGWIYRSVLRNKLNTIDMLNYTKVRSVLSLNDMAEWFYMNDHLKIDGSSLSSTHLDFHWHSYTEAQRAEVKGSVLPLSGSEEIANSAKAKLHGRYPMSQTSYQLITIDNTLYIVLHEGFMFEISKQDFKSEFIKKYLKACYAMTSVSEVSRLSIFDLYMKQFAI